MGKNQSRMPVEESPYIATVSDDYIEKIRSFSKVCETCKHDFLVKAKEHVDEIFYSEALEHGKKEGRRKVLYQDLITDMTPKQKDNLEEAETGKAENDFLMNKYLDYIMNAYGKDIFGMYVQKQVLASKPFRHYRRELQKSIQRRPEWAKGPSLFKEIDYLEEKFFEFVEQVETKQEYKEIAGQKTVKIKNADDWAAALKNVDYLTTVLANSINSQIKKEPELL